MLFEKNDEVRVRFAPSPSGYLHIGGARTAIFNWLFARHHQGKFLLRIEDTDFSRSDKKMVNAIFEGLQRLGLDWDEKVVYQSERLPLYQKICHQLIKNGKAYYCFCSQERLKKLRENKKKDRDSYFYDGRCRHLNKDDIQRFEAQNVPRVVRFRVEPGETNFNDEIHGSLTFDHKEIDDFVILRADNVPTYHLAVVVDDFDMRISHVIRGDDHLTNTPKQILLYQALDWKAPLFAHVPLILGIDKKRLSKRHGATSVIEFFNQGILENALFNFLALLGWSPGGDKEILSRSDLIEQFNLKNINKASAIFDGTKLAWFNSQYISLMTDEELYLALQPLLVSRKDLPSESFSSDYIKLAIKLLKSRLKALSDFVAYGYYFFKDPDKYDKAAVDKYWQDEGSVELLTKSKTCLAHLHNFSETTIEEAIRSLADTMNIGAGKLIHPIRVALTGFAVSPGLFELMATLGKEVTIRRIDKAIQYLISRG